MRTFHRKSLGGARGCLDKKVAYVHFPGKIARSRQGLLVREIHISARRDRESSPLGVAASPSHGIRRGGSGNRSRSHGEPFEGHLPAAALRPGYWCANCGVLRLDPAPGRAELEAGASEAGKEIVGEAQGMRATYRERAEPVGWQPPWATSKQNKNRTWFSDAASPRRSWRGSSTKYHPTRRRSLGSRRASRRRKRCGNHE